MGHPSSSWLTLPSWLVGLQDEQRVERLRYCRELESILKSCRKRCFEHNAPSAQTAWQSRRNGDAGETTLIENHASGLRMMKYFGWRGILETLRSESETGAEHKGKAATVTNPHSSNGRKLSSNAGDVGTSEDYLLMLKEKIELSCAREEHALWACRAVAVGCGKELSSLKSCFDEMGAGAVLIESGTGYEGNSRPAPGTTTRSHQKLPCQDFQAELGKCVTGGANALQERIERRKAEKSSK